MKRYGQRYAGFTIVELLIVIVVIAILAAISIVAYNGIQDRARSSSAQTSAQQASKKIEAQKILDGTYPASLGAAGIQNTSDITYGYSQIDSGDKACVWAQSGTKTYTMQTGSTLIEGQCGQVIASYYNTRPAGSTPEFIRAEGTMSNNWGGNSPDSRIPNDNFTVTYDSVLVAPVTGAYTFTITTDDFSQVFFDGVEVLPYTNTRTSNVNVNLTANQRLRVTYTGAEAGGAAFTIFEWAYPGQSRVSVPSSAFRRP